MAKASLAPSQAYRWVPCPGSVVLQNREGVPTEKTTEAIEEGNAFDELANQLVEMFTNSKLDQPRAGTYLNEPMSNGIVVTEEMYDGAVMYATEVFKYCNEKRILDRVKIQEKVPVDFIDLGRHGAPDISVYWEEGRELVVWDGKYGHKEVNALDNDTMTIYGVALATQLDLDPDVVVRLIIVQPRSYHGDGPVREWTTTVGELFNRIAGIINSANEAKTETARTIPGSHCIGCLTAHTCVALRNTSYNYLDYVSSAQSGGEMSPENLAFELRLIDRGQDMVKARYEALKAQATATVKRGVTVPCWWLKPVSSHLKWDKPPEEVIMLGQLYGKDLTKETQLVTPTQAINNFKIDEAVIKTYASKGKTGQKLVFDDGAKARNVFKQEKN